MTNEDIETIESVQIMIPVDNENGEKNIEIEEKYLVTPIEIEYSKNITESMVKSLFDEELTEQEIIGVNLRSQWYILGFPLLKEDILKITKTNKSYVEHIKNNELKGFIFCPFKINLDYEKEYKCIFEKEHLNRRRLVLIAQVAGVETKEDLRTFLANIHRKVPFYSNSYAVLRKIPKFSFPSQKELKNLRKNS